MTRILCCMMGMVCLLLLGGLGPIEAATDEPALKIDSSAKLTNVLRALHWDPQGPYTAKGARLSGDIEITRAFVLAAKDIAVPAECLRRDDCRRAVIMEIPANMRGVRCARTENVLGTERCVQAELSEKSTFRLRGKLYDTHPWTFNFMPVLEFVEATAAGCKPGQLQCARDKTCWDGFNTYCRYCLERSIRTCACQNQKGPLPDKTACHFFISGDLVCSGECRDGNCVAADERCR